MPLIQIYKKKKKTYKCTKKWLLKIVPVSGISQLGQMFYREIDDWRKNCPRDLSGLP